MLASGLRQAALGLMRRNIAALAEGNPDAIVVACASCGSALKELYAEAFEAAGDAASAQAARDMAAKTHDIAQFLVERGYQRPTKPLERRVTYHDPCHLVRGQGITAQPRAILRSIPGVDFTEHGEADRCCGGGGTFSFSYYELSRRIQERKVRSIGAANPDVIATGCPGCKYHLNDGLQRLGMSQRAVHTVQLLAEAYGERPPGSA